MKIKKQFVVLFVVAFVFSVVLTLISMLPVVNTFDMGSATLIFILGLVSVAISPFLVFFAFYFIGKRADFFSEFKWMVTALLLGNILGSFIVQMLYYFILYGFTIGFVWLWPSLIYGFLGKELFVELAGLAVAYIRQNKKLPITESVSSPLEKLE